VQSLRVSCPTSRKFVYGSAILKIRMRTMSNILHLKNKLIQLTILDTACEIFGSELHKYKLNPCLREAEIQAFEVKHHIQLPDDYRNFLLEVGNGGAGPGYGLMPTEDKNNNFISQAFTLQEAWNDLDLMIKNRSSFIVTPDAYLDNKFIKGTIAIAHYGHGIFALLVILGEQRGNIWIDDRANCGGIYPFTENCGSYLHDNPDDFEPDDCQLPLSFYNWYNDWLNRSLAQVLQS
jgi:SMI1 / KNR4 family (SUKH-1)